LEAGENSIMRSFVICTPSVIIRMIKSRRMRWARHVAGMGEMRYLYKILIGKPEGRRSFGRSRLRWKDNIRINFKDIGWEGTDWIYVA
jgi:hypothetical protein